MYLHTNHFELANATNKKALKMSHPINRYDYYFLCLVRQNIFEQNVEKTKSGLSFLSSIEKTHLVVALNAEISYYLN